MRPHNEPNLRSLAPRLLLLQRQAGRLADTWLVRGKQVWTSAGEPITEAATPELAQYLCDLHTHFLPVLNQLLYRLRGSADLEQSSEPTKR
jgi:hypothetical protein